MNSISEIIKPIELLSGSHADTGATGRGCFMNVIAYLNGEPQITDQSPCVCVVARPIAIWANDFLRDDERHEMLPYIERAMGSATSDPKELSRRAWLAVAMAETMRDIAAYAARAARAASADADAARAARAARAASAAADAARAARGAADAAASAAYADAAADAARAAYAARAARAARAASAAADAARAARGAADAAAYAARAARAASADAAADAARAARAARAASADGCRGRIKAAVFKFLDEALPPAAEPKQEIVARAHTLVEKTCLA